MMDRYSPKLRSLGRHGWLEMNFYRGHIIYFLLTIMLSSVIMYGSGINGNSDDAEVSFKLRYIDAIFLCTSAMTNAGLATINLNRVTGFQQAILCILILIGNVTVTTNATVWVRRYFLRKYMREFLKHSKAAREIVDEVDTERGRIASLANGALHSVSSGIRRPLQTTGLLNLRSSINLSRNNHHEIGHGGLPYPWEWDICREFTSKLATPAHSIQERLHHYLSFQPSFDHKVRPLPSTQSKSDNE